MAIQIGLLIGAVIFSLLNISAVSAADLNTLNKQSSQIQKDIEQKKKEVLQAKKRAEEQAKLKQQNQAAAAKINKDINVTENRITQTQGKIGSTAESIEEQILEINEKAAQIDKKREDINESATELFIAQNSGSGLLAIVGSSSIGSALNEVAALSSLSDKLIEDAEVLDKEKEHLLAVRAQLEQQKQDLEAQKKQLAAYQQALDSQKRSKLALADQAKQEEQRYNGEASEAEKEAVELRKQFTLLSQQINAIIASKRRLTTGDTRGVSALGFIWPLDLPPAVITTYYGGCTIQCPHEGLDIADTAGTPIVSPADGVVLTTANMTSTVARRSYWCPPTLDSSFGYGQYMVIQHSDRVETLYGHMLGFAVSPGQAVKRGQVVGYVGGVRGGAGSGCSTGSHLHFEMREDGQRVNPSKYLP